MKVLPFKTLKNANLINYYKKNFCQMKKIENEIKFDTSAFIKDEDHRISNGKFKLSNVIEYLKSRQTFNQCSNQDLEIKKGDRLYIGFDPTADKLHLGNLLGIVNALRCSTFGIEPVFLIGGATGMIGDPSGKSSERPKMLEKDIDANADKISNLIKTLADSIIESQEYKNLVIENNNFNSHKIRYKIVNNKSFYTNMNILDFMKEIGDLRMGQLLSKDSVKNRLNTVDGLSLNEFMYQSFQAYDFLKLNKEHKVKIQLGGSDQWGNMLTGLEIINRKSKVEVANITHPLLTTSCGKKLGKSEGNSVFIDCQNPNLMYQYILNLSDSDLEMLLLKLTFTPNHEISEILNKHNTQKETRYGQKLLAEKILEMFCDSNKLQNCVFSSLNYFCKELSKSFFENSSKIKVDKEVFDGKILSEFCVDQKLVPSRSQLRRLINSKCVKVNNNLITEDIILSKNRDLYDGEFLMIETSKTKKHIFQCSRSI